mgnify:FL=1
MFHIKGFFLIVIYFLQFAFSECSDLNQTDCAAYPDYCTWNEEQNSCEDNGGGGTNNGPYEYTYLTEFDGLQSSDLYSSGFLYYPIDASPPYKSVVLIDAFGSEPGLINWAQFYASHGYIAMSIGNLDETLRDSNSDWDYMDRAIALLSAIETVKSENGRQISPLFNMIDTSSFAVSGYSTSGGGAHTALTIDSTLKTGILLNPAVAFLDSVNCTAESDYYCLIEEHLNHDVPVLIFAGENEYNELVTPDDDAYDNMWALPQYEHVPDDTDKLYFESANEGHGSSIVPSGIVGKQALFWLNYFMKNDESYCDSVITQPDGVSSFLTSIICEQGPPPPPPDTNIGYLRATEASFCMDDCGMYHLESENGEFLYNVANQNNIPNFEYFVNRFVEIEGDTIQCVECSAVNINSIFLSDQCQQPVSCFVEPCTVSNCSSNDSAECAANYCGGCYADYYRDDQLITCENPGNMNDLSGLDFGLCDMALGFAWVNNHCGMISGCGYIVDDINYSNQFYSSLFDCISASTLKNENEINPSVFRLYQNHPNPFNPSTQIRYQLSISSHVKIAVYNTMGKIVKTLANEYQTAGFRSVKWDGKNNNKQKVSTGVYFYSIQSGEFSSTKKMILLD